MRHGTQAGIGQRHLVAVRLHMGDQLLQVLGREILARVDAVTSEDIQSVARELLTAPATLAVIGPFDETTTFNALG